MLSFPVSFLICVIDIMLIQGTFISTFISQIYIQFSVAATFFPEKCRSLRMFFLSITIILAVLLDRFPIISPRCLEIFRFMSKSILQCYCDGVYCFCLFLVPIVFRLYVKKNCCTQGCCLGKLTGVVHYIDRMSIIKTKMIL